MGAETLFYLNTRAHTVISRCRATADHSKEGHAVKFTIEPESIRIFDPDRGDQSVPLQPPGRDLSHCLPLSHPLHDVAGQ